MMNRLHVGDTDVSISVTEGQINGFIFYKKEAPQYKTQKALKTIVFKAFDIKISTHSN